MAARIDVTARRIAEPTRGLARTRDLCAGGLHGSTVARRVVAGVWERPHPGVIDITCEKWDWARRVLAAVLAKPEGTVASHGTAAALHGLPGFTRSGRIEITTPRAARTSSLPYTVHSSVRPDPGCVIASIPCASSARTLVGLATYVSDRALARAVRDALRRGLVDLTTLHDPALDNLPGTERARTVAQLQASAALLEQESPLEGDVIDRLLALADLPAFTTQHTVRTAGRALRPDIAWPTQRVVVEVDGGRWHADHLAVSADAERQRLLEDDGWTVLRVSAADLADEASWNRFVARLRAALAAAASS